MFNLLDVALGPVYALLFVGAIIVFLVVAAIAYFSFKAIKKIKRERDRS